VARDEESGNHGGRQRAEGRTAAPRFIGETVEQLQVVAWRRRLAEDQETSRCRAARTSKTAPTALALRDIV